MKTLDNTRWTGHSQLWLEPGTPVHESDATAQIEGGVLRYTWSFKGEPQEGILTLTDDGAVWRDTWHQPKDTPCNNAPIFGALVAVSYSYAAPPGPDWHWRIRVATRPDGSLVLQMINITCWGEEAPAVLMVFTRD